MDIPLGSVEDVHVDPLPHLVAVQGAVPVGEHIAPSPLLGFGAEGEKLLKLRLPLANSPHLQNIRVKLFTASPFSMTAVSFQWPCFTMWLIYSSARFTPPLKATRPSMTRIFRWSR